MEKEILNDTEHSSEDFEADFASWHNPAQTFQQKLQARLQGQDFINPVQEKFSNPSPTSLPLQTQLEIGQPNDSYEREADHIAKQVVATQSEQDMLVQTKCATCQIEEDTLHRKSIAEHISPIDSGYAQKKCAACEAETSQDSQLLQKKGDASTASSDLENQINSSKGGGQSMDTDTESQMSQSFGADFSGVRVHTNQQAIQMNEELGARAFTVGNDIYFNGGQYNPSSNSGKELLAHELTHVVQQGGAHTQTSQARRKIQRLGWGSQVQDALRGANQGLVTEAPIPGAAPTSGGAGFGQLGYADLYKSDGPASTIPGIRGFGPDQRSGYQKYKYVNILDSQLDDTEGHTDRSPTISGAGGGPRGNYLEYRVADGQSSPLPSNPSGASVQGDFPTRVHLGEIKGRGDRRGDRDERDGVRQLRAYENGLNRFSLSAHRDLGTRQPNVSLLDDLTIPPGLDFRRFEQERGREGQGFTRASRSPNERIWVAPVQGGSGIYLYELFPHPWRDSTHRQSTQRISQAFERLQEDVLELFRQSRSRRPNGNLGQLKPKTGVRPPSSEIQSKEDSPVSPGDQDHTILQEKGRQADLQKESQLPENEPDQEQTPIQKSAKPPLRPVIQKTDWAAAQRRWAAARTQWKERHANTLLRDDQVEAYAEYLERKVEFERRLGRSSSTPRRERATNREFEKIEFWAGTRGASVGRLRFVLGGKFDLLAEKFERLRERTRQTMGRARRLASPYSRGWRATLVRLLLEGFKQGFEVFVRESFSVFAGCVNGIIEKFEESFQDLEITEELQTRLEGLETTVQALINDIENRYEEQLEEMEEILEQMSNTAHYTTMLTSAITLIRAGVAVISCLTPPALGCLWGLVAQVGIEVGLNLIVGTQWFEDEMMEPLVKDLVDNFVRDDILRFTRNILQEAGLSHYMEGVEACQIPERQERNFYSTQGTRIQESEYRAHADRWESENRAEIMAGIREGFQGTATDQDIEALVRHIQTQGMTQEDMARLVEQARSGSDSYDFGRIRAQIPGAGTASGTETGEEGSDGQHRVLDANEAVYEGESSGSASQTIRASVLAYEIDGNTVYFTFQAQDNEGNTLTVRRVPAQLEAGSVYYSRLEDGNYERLPSQEGATHRHVAGRLSQGVLFRFPNSGAFYATGTRFTKHFPLE